MKYKDQFKFKPQAKFLFAVNTMPRVDDSSTATERRIIIVNFNNNFRDNPNTSLRFSYGVLATELSGQRNFNRGVGRISGWTDTAGYDMPMNWSMFKIYNKVLTVSEVKSNYEATRGRFGI
jgi:hypothetical protein